WSAPPWSHPWPDIMTSWSRAALPPRKDAVQPARVFVAEAAVERIPLRDAVRPALDRDQIIRHAERVEALDHVQRLHVRHARVRRAVDEQERRQVRAQVVDRAHLPERFLGIGVDLLRADDR